MTKQTAFIIAGEASGDLHGSNLVKELLQLAPHLEITGIGGDKMQQQGVQLLHHINEMSTIGFVDVLKRFPFFRKVYLEIVLYLETNRPELVILIDYPGLNLKVAAAAKKLGIKVFYYIAPQVWAWGAGRIKKMREIIDKLAVIIPFEEQFFQRVGIEAQFVGHPLLEVMATTNSKNQFLKNNNLDKNKKILGLLPGSRLLEIKRLFPEMIKTAQQLDSDEVQVVVGCAPTVDLSIYEGISNHDSSIKLLQNSTYDVMKHSDLLIVASGTATLESALFETPLIIVYKVDPISYLLGRMLIKIDNIGLVNVIAERQIVPEFIQHQFTSERMLPAVMKMLFDDIARDAIIENLRGIKSKLGVVGASRKAAQLAQALLK
jgi:lipid-A-disaccharide synthase